jgi:hypothetical protein
MTGVFDPSKVIIDDHTVPNVMKCLEEYKWRREEIEARLCLPNAIEVFSTHEAGHIIYFKLANLPAPILFGPTIEYDGKRFSHCTVGVKPPDLENNVGYFTGKFMIRLARAAVAGGVFLEALMGYSEKDNGDADDWDLFERYCKTVQRYDTTRDYNPPKRWRKARAKVKRDLDTNIITMTEIQNAKAEFRAQVFPSL